MMNKLKGRPTTALILIMMVVVGVALIIIKYYYHEKNQSVDPRVTGARNLYATYDRFARNSQIDSIFPLLDSIESTYNQIPHYRNSFETGVLYVNRAAAWLTISIYRDSIPSYQKVKIFGELPADSLNQMAEQALRYAIILYEEWISAFKELSKEQIKTLIQEDFVQEAPTWTEKEQSKYLNNRILEIANAQVETPRRLSVAYTNLGILCRMRGQYEDAARMYKKAIELWDRNLTAENNLNRLLGRPLKKESWIRRMFPPEKK